MNISGRVHNGVVVLDGASALPEGATVTVTFPALAETKPGEKKRHIQLTLIQTGEPGTLDLTNARIAEILDEEDASSARCWAGRDYT
jgi:hypothetical protein